MGTDENELQPYAMIEEFILKKRKSCSGLPMQSKEILEVIENLICLGR